MKKGRERFEYHLNQLQVLLDKAATQANPALWLYRNNARTPLFMLEGLAKLYRGIHNRKKFDKLKTHFKLLEDGLGAIDYYDTYAKELAANKKIPKTVISHLQAKTREKTKHLNEVLKEKKWLQDDKNRVKKIRKKLKNADWLDEAEEVKRIHNFYQVSINEILEFINKKDFHFIDVEHDVHEFRRMIRWLSIYPQALRGCIQLSESKSAVPPFISKYLTPEITGSKYNVMPDAGDQKHFLLLNKNRFFALSWMILELGNLKDGGLRVEAIKEAILHAGGTGEKAALAKVRRYTGPKQISVQQVLDTAEALCKTYCKEKNLENLVTGTATVT